MRWGVVTFWGLAGGLALISSLWVDWFTFHLAGVSLNIGWPAIVYAGVLTTKNLMLRPHLEMTPRELHDFGGKLEKATPQIVEMIADGAATKDVANAMFREYGIPEETTLKYIIAVAKYQKKHGGDGADGEHSES